jgi:hypothetical protein
MEIEAWNYSNRSSTSNEELQEDAIFWKVAPCSSLEAESKGFWRWCIMLRTTGFLDFVHRPVF